MSLESRQYFRIEYDNGPVPVVRDNVDPDEMLELQHTGQLEGAVKIEQVNVATFVIDMTKVFLE